MTDLVLDPTQSRVRIRTFAEGLLARLAHDLELTCRDLGGTATSEGKSGKGSIAVPLGGMTVAGVLKDGHLDDRALSATERRDIVAKMQHDVFHAGPEGVVRVEVHLDGSSARIRIVPPNGRAVETVIQPELRPDGAAVRATGAFEVSLMALGSEVVKGPMNAFRVKDKVRLTFDVLFAQVELPKVAQVV